MIEIAQQYLNGFKGEDGVRGNPFSECLELNLTVGIANLIKATERSTREAIRDAILREQMVYNQEPGYSLIAALAEIAMTCKIKE